MLDVALIKYDAGTQSAESKAAGEGPCIHHFAVEVDDIKEATKQVKAYGCEIISDPGVIPVKFRAPGGTVCELVPKGRYKKPKPRKKPSPGDEGAQRRFLVGPGARRPRRVHHRCTRRAGSTSARTARARGSSRSGTGLR